MPEGDTIARTARSLESWLAGRTITAARSVFASFPAARLVGAAVDGVEARGKHLLIRLSTGDVIHTHMRMTGGWHVYEGGARWRRPAHQARLVIEAGDRVAVCFNAPVVELLRPGGAAAHPALVTLGPDVLSPQFDPAAAVARTAALPVDTPVGAVLLDQRVAAGIGNIWRNEALFHERLHPAVPLGDVAPGHLAAAFAAASRLMKASAARGGVRPRALVYRRAGRPCVRCRTTVESGPVGDPPRTAYWCPRCQPVPGPLPKEGEREAEVARGVRPPVGE